MVKRRLFSVGCLDFSDWIMINQFFRSSSHAILRYRDCTKQKWLKRLDLRTESEREGRKGEGVEKSE